MTMNTKISMCIHRSDHYQLCLGNKHIYASTNKLHSSTNGFHLNMAETNLKNIRCLSSEQNDN